ncbi:MAG: response regulator transcription factor [Elusimicrobia bacterium]|nr:response regulator transcription factor [Elusimicrobiota bacterium]
MILVVEDPREYGKLLESALQALGVPLFSASGGADALRVALEKKPKLVVAAAALPGASGFELCRVFRERKELAGLRVLVVSDAHCPEEAALRAAGFAPDLVLPKPFRVAELHAAVRRLLA